MAKDRLLTPEDLSIREPLFWSGLGFFYLGLLGGLWSDLTWGGPVLVAVDGISLVVGGLIALFVRFRGLRIQTATAGVVYLAASNFLVALAQTVWTQAPLVTAHV